MSEEFLPQDDMNIEMNDSDAGEEVEEINSEEVDRVVNVLEELIENVDSENIASILEDASNAIFYLVYDEGDLEDDTAEAA